MRGWELDPVVHWAPQPRQTGPRTRLLVGHWDGCVRRQKHGCFGHYVRPIRVVWSDKDGEKSEGLGLHKLLAEDPRAWVGRAPRREGVGARPHVLGVVGPMEAPSLVNGHTLRRWVGWDVRTGIFGGRWEVGRQRR